MAEEDQGSGAGRGVAAVPVQPGGSRLPGSTVSLPVKEILRGSENYNSWAFATKMVLIKERTWRAVRDPVAGEPAVDADTSEQALATICLSMDRGLRGMVQTAKTAREAWDILRDTFEDSGSTRRIGLLRKLTGIRLVGAEKVEETICHSTHEYVSEIMVTCNQLADVGFEVDDDWVSCLLLKGLPKKYAPMILGLESSGVKLTADKVKATIMQEVKVEAGSSSSEGEGAFYSKQKQFKKPVEKSGVKCFRCKKLGHYASECKNGTSAKSNEKSGNHKGNATSFFAAFNAVESPAGAGGDWIIDSGATTHMCRNEGILDNASSLSAKINVANNAEVAVVAKGSVKLEADCNGAIWDLTVNDVVCVPDLAINLLSVSKMCQRGFRVEFTKDACKVLDASNSVVAIGRETDGLYKLTETKRSRANLVQADDKFELWHRRMGHLSASGMKRLREMTTGAQFEMKNELQCVPCIEGKHHRQPFNARGQRAERVLELVHSDLCGPMETASIGGRRYFLTFIDDASRKTVVYFLKSKTEVLESFQDFKAFAENQTGERIKRIRTDNGREYVNREMKEFLRKSGIHHEMTAPYNPEQNGLAERRNRTYVERARSMLFDAGLDKSFWAEAVATASHVINRSPAKGLSVTPEEKFTGKRPDLSHLRVFGTKCMAHVPKERRRKWDKKSEPCIFVGYSNNSKAYRVYSLRTKSVVISRDVIFLDEKSTGTDVASTEPAVGDEEMELVVPSIPIEDGPAAEEEAELDESDISDYESVEDDADLLIEAEEVPLVLPPQPEDPQVLVRRSGREHVPPGKYQDFVMNCSTLPEKDSHPKQNRSTPMMVEPDTFREAIARDDSDQWKRAMEAEFGSLVENRTWELTDLPKGRKALRCKWVYKLKTNSDGSVERYKARLVIKGYSQIKGVDYNETFSPVVRYATIRYLMSLAAKLDLKVHQMDAVTAFLQGDLGEEEIYMEQPEGFTDSGAPTKVCKLRKALYGLKQASRVWNQKLDAELKRSGLKRSAYDTCVYYKLEGNTVLIVAVYVDDLLVFSNNQQWVNKLKKDLMTRFRMKDLGMASKVLGMRVTRGDGKVMLDQEQYINELLQRFNVAECNAVSTPADPTQKLTKEMCPSTVEEREQMAKVPFRELVGGLQYLALSTRPDICFAVNAVSQFSSNPGKAHWIAAKRVLRYLKGTKTMKLTYSKHGDQGFVGYSDADWGNDPETRRSITGYVYLEAGGSISWSCRKQTTVALSTMEAEYMAVSAATQEALWWRGLLKELFGVAQPVTIHCDNMSAVHLAEKEIGYSPRSKHIDIRHHFVRENVEEKLIKLEHVATEAQKADVFTKPVAVSKYLEARKALGILG